MIIMVTMVTMFTLVMGMTATITMASSIAKGTPID